MFFLRFAWHAALFLLLEMFLSAVVLADDGATYTGSPHFRIESKHKILLSTCVHIKIVENNITASYNIKNISSHRSDIKIIFDIPSYEWMGAGNWYADRSYSDLQLFIKGKQIEYNKISKAMHGGIDITSKLYEFGLSPNDVGTIEWESITKNIFKKYIPLRNIGIFDKSNFPAWSAKNIYTYALSIPGNGTVELMYKHKLLLGSGYFSKNDSDALEMLRQFNMAWRDICNMFERKCVEGDYYGINWMDLPLHPDDWKGGMHNVTIDIIPPGPGKRLIMLSINGIVIRQMSRFHKKIKSIISAKEIPLTLVYFGFAAEASAHSDQAN